MHGRGRPCSGTALIRRHVCHGRQQVSGRSRAPANDVEPSAGRRGRGGLQWGDYSLPSGAMDFSHDWAPIVTPAPTQRRSWESTRSGGTPTRPSTSGNSEASRVDALGHALQQGLGWAAAGRGASPVPLLCLGATGTCLSPLRSRWGLHPARSIFCSVILLPDTLVKCENTFTCSTGVVHVWGQLRIHQADYSSHAHSM